MKAIMISANGDSLPIVWRLRREGADIDVYIHNPKCRHNYDGIMPKLSVLEVKDAIKKAKVVLFDVVRVNEKTKEDATLLKTFSAKTNVPEVFGAVADVLKKDHQIIGASSMTSELELDRRKGMQIAKQMGFELPEYKEFKTLKDGIEFLKSQKDLWYFKPDNNMDLDLTYGEQFEGELMAKMENEYAARLGNNIEYILEKKIDGAEISTEVWIGDKGLVNYNHTIENKQINDGNLGLSIGSQSNTVWLENPIESKCPVIPLMTRMGSYLLSQGYRGPADANCIIKNGKPYFLEWSLRFGYDALFCLLTLVRGKFSDFFFNDFICEWYEGFASSQRITIPPFPYSNPDLRKAYAKDVVMFGQLKDYPFFWAEDILLDNKQLKCAGSDGILGVATAYGKTLEESWGRVYHNIKQLKVAAKKQYRLDGLAEASKRFNKLKAA